MNDKTRVWVWGGVAVLLVAFAAWWYYQSKDPVGELATAGYGAPAASSTNALEGPTAMITPENRGTTTVASVVATLGGESRFAGLLSSTGVAATLSGKGPYTIFVPTDASFGMLPAGTINNLNATELKRLVQYHIVSGKMIDVNAQVAGTVQALSKDMLNFSKGVNDVSARVNSSAVVRAYRTSNGVVYVVNQVLLPPTSTQ